MLITCRPGVDRAELLTTLRTAYEDVTCVYAEGYPPYERMLEYLKWATKAADRLRYQISAADLDALILTRGHDALLRGMSDLSAMVARDTKRTESVISGIVDLELTGRMEALDYAVNELQNLIHRWGDDCAYVLPDSSFYIQHPEKLEDIDFHSLLKATASRPVFVLFPTVVVDELDRLKESKDRRQRWRAAYTLAVLDRVLGDTGHGTLRPPVTRRDPKGYSFVAEVDVEILFDPPGHVRLPVDDDEIVDRGIGAQQLAGRNGVTLLTYDTGQATRGRMAGLQVKKIPHEGGTGEEPNWTADEGQQGRGNGLRAQRKARREAEEAAADA